MNDQRPCDKLRDAVEYRFQRHKSISTLVRQSLKDAGLKETEEVRRDFDGVSQADWLAEKMIGEMLIDGRTQP